MKKINLLFSLGFSVASLTPLVSNVVSCTSSQSVASKVKNIIDPERGWPPENKKFLDAWDDVATSAQAKVVSSLQNWMNNYGEEYIKAWKKYQKNPADSNVKTDDNGVPQDVTDNITRHFWNNDKKNIYVAYSLVQYYALIKKAEIENGSNYNFKSLFQNDNLELLYALYFFRGISMYEGYRIRLQKGIGFSVTFDLNYYDFYGTCVSDESGIEYDFTKTKPFPDGYDVPRNNPSLEYNTQFENGFFLQKTVVHSSLNKFIDRLFNMVFYNKELEK